MHCGWPRTAPPVQFKYRADLISVDDVAEGLLHHMRSTDPDILAEGCCLVPSGAWRKEDGLWTLTIGACVKQVGGRAPSAPRKQAKAVEPPKLAGLVCNSAAEVAIPLLTANLCTLAEVLSLIHI